MGHSELRETSELVRAPAIPERAPPEDARQAPESSLTATVLQLQRAAGNQAVTSALTASRSFSTPALPLAIQRAPAGTGGNGSIGLQLAAVWDTQVLVPLARAAERLARAKPDLNGARPNLDTALRTITAVRKATPAEDPNHSLLEIVEQRARGVLDLVDQRLGLGPKGNKLENEMIRVRSEAAALGPTLQHMPKLDTELSIAEVWKILVIDRLWSVPDPKQTQAAYWEREYENWTGAASQVGRFYEAAPEGHPNRIQLMKTGSEMVTVSDLMAARAGARDAVVDRAEGVYASAVDMADFLFGQPAATSLSGAGPPEASSGTSEPDFTWERERPPMVNDTELERP